ncbi:rhamnulokinase [Sporanaerobium hydrogeniformans]|uniref:Rhamnulokinase n=1 Tax=Sporanaerobium hydrogeniformans TaxID=3072179 RepID=A0AC61DH35_9FIRM|nr:rhamnulokinase family protein [Sporanaerobium hydrogeniformans]PHV72125.1 rhamnulokinase [Sporanaerobium hydrogeniformans]
MKQQAYVAIDLGASSGRLILGTMQEGKLNLEEIHRFTNDPVYLGDTFYWDFMRIFHEIKQGLKKLSQRSDIEVTSIGIDTWGVDGAWLDKNGRLLTNPIHYRDARTSKTMDAFYNHITDSKLYDITGIQKMSFNTVYQLYYDMTQNEVVKNYGEKWLFMPDLIAYFLTGSTFNEYSIASTGALLDAKTRTYSKELFEALGLPLDKMQPIVMPGTVVGTLTAAIQEETGLGEVKVVAVGSHDTASAVAGAPLETENEVYLCCGTWCLMGMELQEPILSENSKDFNITNEGGVEGTIRYLKNINGLWFLQQLRKVWNERGLNLSFPDIIAEVQKSNCDFAVDATADRFMAPLNMEKEIIAYCKETYGVTLETVGDIAKAAYNGLAIHYKEVLEMFENITGKSIETVRMVGGGIQDQYLCQRVADSTGKQVVAGPIEASCIGNMLMQMKAVGTIKSLNEGRQIVRESFEQKHYSAK